MTARILLVTVFLAAGMSACTDFSLFDDDAAAPNGCTTGGCPQAAQYCTARGYHPGSDRYDRCMLSVEENLRKGQ